MEKIILAHRFFDFGIKQWEQFQNDSGRLEELFQKNLLPRRALRVPGPKNLAEALCLIAKYPSEARAVPHTSPEYPEALLHLGEAAPPLVYQLGAPIPPLRSLVSIVGTRRPSSSGIQEAKHFTNHVLSLGLGTVSGLAVGIDGVVHKESLPDYTLAVLGSSLEECFPPVHEELKQSILQNGGSLLSPFPFLQVSLPQNFPRRNRWISALSAGCIVIEGAEKSGALLTGKYSLELGRTCICLTRDFRSDFGRGAISLLENGATAVRSEEEAMRALAFPHGGELLSLGVKSSRSRRLPWQKSFSLVQYQQKFSLSFAQALRELGELERRGKVTRREDSRYDCNS